MNKIQRLAGLLLAFALFAPALATAQVTGSTTVDVQVQSLLSQITSLEQQLMSLVKSVAPTSTPPTWNASSTSPNATAGPMMDGCPSFSRDLSQGDEGSDVMQLQQFLNGEGFFSASSTGFFGALTAQALDQFQMHFGISTSSAGFFGPLTQTFIGAHCGQTGMGTSTRPTMMEGSTTPPMMGHPASTTMMWNDGTSTRPTPYGPMGSTTGPRPCPQNASQGAAAALFVPHVILPAIFFNPCTAPASSTSKAAFDQ